MTERGSSRFAWPVRRRTPADLPGPEGAALPGPSGAALPGPEGTAEDIAAQDIAEREAADRRLPPPPPEPIMEPRPRFNLAVFRLAALGLALILALGLALVRVIGAGPPSIAQLRAAAGDAILVGEVYLLSDRLGPYLEHLDACFSFELLHAPWEADKVRAAVAAASATGQAAWVLSNHDFSRLPDRVGPANVRAAALLLLTLPGMTFVYQGDELGMADGPDGGHDRSGRDRHRTPMPWDDTPNAGFTTGRPWLETAVPAGGTAADQQAAPDSMLAWYRELIAVRRDLAGDVEMLDSAPGLVAFRRGRHVIALNLGDTPQHAPAGTELVPGTPASSPREIHPGGAIIATG